MPSQPSLLLLLVVIAENNDQGSAIRGSAVGILKTTRGLHESVSPLNENLVDLHPAFKISGIQRFAKRTVELNNKKTGKLPVTEFRQAPCPQDIQQLLVN